MQYEPAFHRDWIKTLTDQTLILLWVEHCAPSEKPITDYCKAVDIFSEMQDRNLLPENMTDQF